MNDKKRIRDIVDAIEQIESQEDNVSLTQLHHGIILFAEVM
jgi:hypothetical protein